MTWWSQSRIGQRLFQVAVALVAITCDASMAAQPAAQTTKELRATIDAAVLPLMARHDIPGMAVGVILDGAPVDRATLLHLGTYTAGGLPLQFPTALMARRRRHQRISKSCVSGLRCM